MKTQHQAYNSTAPHSSASPQPTLEKLGVGGGVGVPSLLGTSSWSESAAQDQVSPLQFLQTLGAASDKLS